MAFRDILLNISTYPEPTPPAAIDHAVQVAASMGGSLSALAITVSIPVAHNRAADALVGLSAIARDEEAKSRRASSADLAHFTAQATAAGVLGDTLSAECHLYEVAKALATAARTRDLCIVPLGAPLEGRTEIAEGVIFGSGRPVLLFGPQSFERPRSIQGRVVVAWDGSRSAARAMADAMPILTRAKDVQVLVVEPEARNTLKAPAFEALRHLKAHQVNASLHEISGHGRSVGDAIETALSERSADLLVMGAYGHSRLRELVLGGATEHMIRTAPVPIFLSH